MAIRELTKEAVIIKNEFLITFAIPAESQIQTNQGKEMINFLRSSIVIQFHSRYKSRGDVNLF
jgi:hypothetical protein